MNPLEGDDTWVGSHDLYQWPVDEDYLGPTDFQRPSFSYSCVAALSLEKIRERIAESITEHNVFYKSCKGIAR